MKTTFQVQVTRRGTITLPKKLRKRNNIVEGDTLTIRNLGNDVVVMQPTRPNLDKIANKLAREWWDAGESLESMLAALHEVRTKKKKSNPS